MQVPEGEEVQHEVKLVAPLLRQRGEQRQPPHRPARTGAGAGRARRLRPERGLLERLALHPPQRGRQPVRATPAQLQALGAGGHRTTGQREQRRGEEQRQPRRLARKLAQGGERHDARPEQRKDHRQRTGPGHLCAARAPPRPRRRNAVGSTRAFRPTRPSTTRSRRKSARPASSRTCACRVRTSGSDAGAASQAGEPLLAPRGRRTRRGAGRASRGRRRPGPGCRGGRPRRTARRWRAGRASAPRAGRRRGRGSRPRSAPGPRRAGAARARRPARRTLPRRQRASAVAPQRKAMEDGRPGEGHRGEEGHHPGVGHPGHRPVEGIGPGERPGSAASRGAGRRPAVSPEGWARGRRRLPSPPGTRRVLPMRGRPNRLSGGPRPRAWPTSRRWRFSGAPSGRGCRGCVRRCPASRRASSR